MRPPSCGERSLDGHKPTRSPDSEMNRRFALEGHRGRRIGRRKPRFRDVAVGVGHLGKLINRREVPDPDSKQMLADVRFLPSLFLRSGGLPCPASQCPAQNLATPILASTAHRIGQIPRVRPSRQGRAAAHAIAPERTAGARMTGGEVVEPIAKLPREQENLRGDIVRADQIGQDANDPCLREVVLRLDSVRADSMHSPRNL